MASENESEKRETLADIVREKRSMAAVIRANLSNVPARREDQLLEADSLDREADRIEAAWELEMTEAEADALAVGGIVEAARHKPGNAAAMREALEALIAYWDWNGFDAMRESQLKDMARAALAAPPRNCDLFGGDQKMLNTAWFDWTASPSGHDAIGVAKMTFAGWLLAPAAERKGE